MIPVNQNNRGFTLIELMVAMVIALIVMASIYKVYTTYQKADSAQRLVVDMVQNARSAMLLMEREIRMAGHAPAATDGQDNDDDTKIDESGTGEDQDYPGGFPRFYVVKKDTVQFTMDFMPNDAWCTDGTDNDDDGDTDELDECYSNGNTSDLNENITYSLNGTTLMRDDANDLDESDNPIPPQVLAYDIEAIAFAYAYDADGDHELDTDGATPVPNVIWAYDSDGDGYLDTDIATGSFTPTVDIKTADVPPRSAIKAVKIWLLARTASPIRNYTDSQSYQVGDQMLIKNDHYKRTLLTAIVYCRNTRF